MIRRILVLCSLISVPVVVPTPAHAADKIILVNVIPRALSAEVNQDSEPNLAVNAANPNQIVISAFTPGLGFCASNIAPVFASDDGGSTWRLRCSVPSEGSTADISLRFSGGNRLYASLLRRPDLAMTVVRSESSRPDSTMDAILVRPAPDSEHIIDQPYIQAAMAGPDAIFIGENDWRTFSVSVTATASIDESDDASLTSPVFKVGAIEMRAPVFDLPSVRPAVHKDGTVYAAYISVTQWDDSRSMATADIVVVRRDPGGPGFSSLTDSDGRPGKKVATGRLIPWGCCIGQQRFGSHLTIATDPKDSRVVYVGWADSNPDSGEYTLHVRKSSDRGKTWPETDVWTVRSAVNPAIAINEDSIVGFAYQRLIARNTEQRWQTIFTRTGGAEIILADTPAGSPHVDWQPYLGDYLHLLTVNSDFFGVFSANNSPVPPNFPAVQPTYNRNHDFARGILLSNDNKSEVRPSIDPFFFHIVIQ